jgi:glucoamylase
LLQSLSTPFSQHRESFVEQWRRASATLDLSEHTGDGGGLYRLSRCILLAHEDKTFRGAIVASMSIPWGETKGDDEIGGYHLVWPRDLMQSATGLLASGQTETPRAALIWLACLQEANGELPQNSWIHGDAYWTGLQLDEVAAPILLAWHLHQAGALGLFDPWTIISRAASYLILHGPVTRQERWEEVSGYSPTTLAAIAAGLVVVAEFARMRGDEATAQFALDYADWLSAHFETWMMTTRGELVTDRPRHYVRITPADPRNPHASAEPDTAMLRIANGGGEHPARNVVGGDFLAFVRLGLRDALDPLIVESLAVLDAVIKHDLPQGPCWQRYNHDCYGQYPNGAAFDGGGIGGTWPLLTGERGHYEISAGRDATPYIKALERFSNSGGMLPEQVWFGDAVAGTSFKPGAPTGSAMPLCWAHAEYLCLVRSQADGIPFDRIVPAYQRYVEHRTGSRIEMWSCAHRLARIPAGKTLRIIAPGPGEIQWSASNGTAGDSQLNKTSLGIWFTDLPTAELQESVEIVFALLCDGQEARSLHRVIVAAVN